ncbi:MAG TPA: DMT family transporter [Streptosporangiaceae bacterium]
MLILALAAAVLYGTADFLGGVASRRASALAVMAVTMPAGALVVLAAALAGATFAHGIFSANSFGTWQGAAWAAAGGVAGAVGLAAFYSGFARAPMSVVAPISALVSTVLPVAVAIVGGMRPGAPVIAGAAACLAAIVLVSVQHRDADNPPVSEPKGRGGAWTGAFPPSPPQVRQRRGKASSSSALEASELDNRASATLRGLAYGVVAGMSFGLFFLFLKNAGHSAVLWPVVVQRVTGSVLALAVIAVAGIRPLWRGEVNRRLLAIALLSGVVDAIANVCYVLATRAGEFGLAVVLTSLYPGATVLLARLVLRERMRALQQFGLLLAAVGIVLVTALAANDCEPSRRRPCP